MVNCCILSCPSNAAHAEISFFRFPVIRADEESRRLSLDRRAAWIVAVNRKHINFDYALVCSRHFVSGRPAKLHEYRHPDWIPSLELCPSYSSSPVAEVAVDVEESIRSTVVLATDKSTAGCKAIETIIKSDAAKICRLCLGKDVNLVKSLQTDNGTDHSLLQKIYDCTTIKLLLKQDYPLSICAICDTKITEYARFREKCIENENFLRTVFRDIPVNETESPITEAVEEVELIDLAEPSDVKDVYGSSDETTLSQSEFAKKSDTDAEITSIDHNIPAPVIPKITSITSISSISSDDNEPVIIIERENTPTENNASISSPPPPPPPQTTAKPALISVKPISSLASTPPASSEQASSSTPKELPTVVGADGRLECVICARPFRNTYTLRRHMNLHTEQNLFTCEYCGKKFNDRSNWKIHLRAHTGDNLLRCAVCFKTFISPSTLKYHLRAHRKMKVFECRLCVETTTSYDALSEHISVKHGDIRAEDLARASDDAFVAGDFLKIEMEADETTITATITSHEGSLPQSSELVEVIEAQQSVAQKSLSKSTTRKDTEAKQAPDDTDLITPLPTASPTSEEEVKIKEEMPDVDEVEIKQELVDDETAGTVQEGEKDMQDQLTALIPTADEDAPPVILFRCDYCMKIFKYLYELRVHMKLHNGTNLPAPPADKAGSATPSARLVIATDPPAAKKPRHPSIDEDVGELVNAPLPEHKCSKCDKCFRTEELLKVHIETHKSDEDVTQARSCKVCFKTFKCELNLVSHMRKHHPYETYVSEQQQLSTVDDKPASPDSSSNDGNVSQGETATESSSNADSSGNRKCEICALSFDCTFKLEKHVLTHFKNNEAVSFVPSADRPYKCTECHKRFKRKDYLLIHIRTHTGERRHKCDMCSSAFVHPSNLITHRKLHSNERPFKCDLCPAAFKLYAGLKIHRKRCALKYLQENSVSIS